MNDAGSFKCLMIHDIFAISIICGIRLIQRAYIYSLGDSFVQCVKEIQTVSFP